MGQDAAGWSAQRRGWSTLNGLHPTPLDLGRLALIRDAAVETLLDPQKLESLLLCLGLNDEALSELPHELHAHCGQGLRIWQYPTQFSKYLTQLARLEIRSYLEIGIRHGGSFVTTTEYLRRFHALEFAVGVDIIPCPSIEEYRRNYQPAQFWCLNTRGAEFAARLDELGTIDLVFIDSHHQEEQCRKEFESLSGRANAIAFHDIVNVGCPGVARVWQEVKRMSAYHCVEYVDQYGALGPFMGIGLAIRKGRLPMGEET